MLSLEKLMRNTPADVIDRSRQTRVGRMKVVSSRKKGVDTLVFVASCQAITEKVFYDVTIELYPGEVHRNVFHNPSLSNPAWVQCECQYFLFTCEYALARSGNTEIMYSNGRPSYITNKSRFGKFVPFLCKHLYRAAPEVIKAAQDLAKREKRDYKFVP